MNAIKVIEQAVAAFEDAITSLRQAIAEAEKQEPFAYYFEEKGYSFKEERTDSWFVKCPCDGKLNGKDGLKLYDHSQPKQEAVQPDSVCKEDDGCPTEKAVLQKFWRENQSKAEKHVAYTTGHCKEKAQPNGCQLHNLHCGYPACDRKAVVTPQPKRPLTELQINDRAKAEGAHNADFWSGVRFAEAYHGIKE